MPSNKTPIQIVLTSDERCVLQQVARSLSSPHRDVVRAQVVLGVAEGVSLSELSRRVGLARRIVRKWAERFLRKRLLGLNDAPRSGRPPRFSPCGDDGPGQAGLRAP